MSADIPTAFPAYEGNTLDALLIDPEVKSLLDTIQVINAENGGMTVEEARHKVLHFDRKWKDELGLMYEEAMVSGTAIYAFGATESQPMEFVAQPIDDILVRSEGFTIMYADENETDEDSDERKMKVGLLFKELFKDGDTLTGECTFALSIDTLQSVVFQEAMSLQQAEALLDYYLPHIRLEIDDAIDTSEDEVVATFALANHFWDTSSVLEDQVRARNAINIYIGSKLVFDALPYMMNAFEAETFVVEEDNHFVAANIVTTDDTLVSVRRVVFIGPFSADGDTNDFVVAHLDCELYDDEMFSKPSRVMLPVSSVKYLHSIRGMTGAEDA